ncbi:hypothetical protein SBOR_7825 [Sclerotinia borealis F-4128]|uniref:Protein kinase domain-containing protein n=1 Tax=Sclerotinia borealis (strain F-4128) TaxID=1432307 RepID=W9C4X1_SCLBF|nr:hypothetical protein SBOR_7825 [Sclerotinia borealis F-4128]
MNNKMIASERAICKVRLPVNERSCEEPDLNRQYNLNLKWADSIQKLFFTDQESPDRNNIRNFDIVLNLDGSADNYFQDQQASSRSAMLYLTRYQLPEAISGRLNTTEERIARAELFALGRILYEITSGHQLFHEIDESVDNEREIQRLTAIGNFPEDLWNLPTTPRILACLCPGFKQEMLSFRKKGSLFIFNPFIYLYSISLFSILSLQEPLCSPYTAYTCLTCLSVILQIGIRNYIKKHPYRFGFQVLSGVATVASVAAVPVLGAVGFSAAGPVAGSTAAAWQSSIGLIEVGSVFAWCQSAAMGGAAVGGIIGAGVGGAGLLAGATSLGALDGADFNSSELKERFRAAWNRDMKGE